MQFKVAQSASTAPRDSEECSKAFCSRHSQPSLYSHELKGGVFSNRRSEGDPCTHLQRPAFSMSTPRGARLPRHQSNMFSMCFSNKISLYLNFFVPMMLYALLSCLALPKLPSSSFASVSAPEVEPACMMNYNVSKLYERRIKTFAGVVRFRRRAPLAFWGRHL